MLDLRVPSGWFFTLLGVILVGMGLIRAGCARRAHRRQRQFVQRHRHAGFRHVSAADGPPGREQEPMIDAFRSIYGSADGVRVFRAPGRVNLIGEHTDYNLGFVLPVALDMATYVATAPAGRRQAAPALREAPGDARIRRGGAGRACAQRIIGPIIPSAWPAKWRALGFAIQPANLLIRSTVPEGSGLSSSAALEVSSALAFLGGREVAPLELAKLCQRAEREFRRHALRHHGSVHFGFRARTLGRQDRLPQPGSPTGANCRTALRSSP